MYFRRKLISWCPWASAAWLELLISTLYACCRLRLSAKPQAALLAGVGGYGALILFFFGIAQPFEPVGAILVHEELALHGRVPGAAVLGTAKLPDVVGLRPEAGLGIILRELAGLLVVAVAPFARLRVPGRVVRFLD